MAKKRTIEFTLLSARLSKIFFRLGFIFQKMVIAKNVLNYKSDNYSLSKLKSSVFQPIVDDNLNLCEVFFLVTARPIVGVLLIKNTKRNNYEIQLFSNKAYP